MISINLLNIGYSHINYATLHFAIISVSCFLSPWPGGFKDISSDMAVEDFGGLYHIHN